MMPVALMTRPKTRSRCERRTRSRVERDGRLVGGDVLTGQNVLAHRFDRLTHRIDHQHARNALGVLGKLRQRQDLVGLRQRSQACLNLRIRSHTGILAEVEGFSRHVMSPAPTASRT